MAPLLEKTLGAIRISQRAGGLSRRAWISALPTLEAGGVAVAIDGPFPERYQPGVPGAIMAAGEAGLEELRRSLAAG